MIETDYRTVEDVPPTADPGSLFILAIDTPDDIFLTLHRTRKSVIEHLVQYVETWWGHVMEDEELPADEIERISAYFERAQENLDGESWVVQEEEIHG